MQGQKEEERPIHAVVSISWEYLDREKIISAKVSKPVHEKAFYDKEAACRFAFLANVEAAVGSGMPVSAYRELMREVRDRECLSWEVLLDRYDDPSDFPCCIKAKWSMKVVSSKWHFVCEPLAVSAEVARPVAPASDPALSDTFVHGEGREAKRCKINA